MPAPSDHTDASEPPTRESTDEADPFTAEKPTSILDAAWNDL